MVVQRDSDRPSTQGYGQYCPLALAAELLCRRWSLLVVSRLIDGCDTFSAIQRGLPRISPSLLATRLTELEDAGLVTRIPLGQRRCRYQLTEAGAALEDIVMALAAWGQQWARDMSLEDLDPAFLAWSMHTRLDSSAMPPGRTVIEFELTGSPTGLDRFWLLNEDGRVDMCLKNPGFDTDLLVQAPLQRFVEAWRGFRSLESEMRAGHIRVSGPPSLVHQLPGWLQLSALAAYPRRRHGRERALRSKAPGAADR